jgi:hypothetical protein
MRVGEGWVEESRLVDSETRERLFELMVSERGDLAVRNDLGGDS